MNILDYVFMQRALVATILVGSVCATLGCYIVVKRMAFIGSGIAHSAFGGVALGFLLGLNPMTLAIPFCLAVAFGIGWLSQRGKLSEDTAIGIFYASTMALGVLLLGLSRGYNVDLFGYLFGSILSVSSFDLWLILSLSFVVMGTVVLFFKELLFLSFDEELAKVSGLPVRELYYLLLGLITLTIILSIKIVGIILVSALLVIPAAAAFQLARRFVTMMVISILVGVISGVAGLFLSYSLNLASGATIVLIAAVIFGICFILSPKRRRLKLKISPTA